MMGGLWAELMDGLGAALEAAGFQLRVPRPGLEGTHPENVCNRGRLGAGAQLEISAGLRTWLQEDPDHFRRFTGAVREALEDQERSLGAERARQGHAVP
jgi:phage replication-related protein YjqB (UPF0714/DUF867 family)